MKYLIINKLRNFLGIFFNFFQKDKRLQLQVLEESAESHQNRVIYLIGDNGKYWFAEMQCPCGCGDSIQLKLFGDSPKWEARVHNGNLVTLHPSVWRTKGCRSHFFVRKSKILWAKNM